MNHDEHKEELSRLVGDTLEHLRYLRELGVEQFGDTDARPIANAPVRVSSDETREPQQVSALRRNAAAHDVNMPVVTRLMPPATIPPETLVTMPPLTSHDPLPVAPPPPTRPDSEPYRPPTPPIKTFMPDNKNTATTRPEPPPQETLFGEITPADDDSLPQIDETIEDIRRDIGDCTRCPLYAGRQHIVHSDGNFDARLMFVGEAPGADEDASGKPFVGRAGQLLNKIIEAIGMKREDVIIGNVNRCRPPQNRTPTPVEAKTCKPFLLREIAIIQPQIIVVMGNTAMKNLLDTKEGITKLRGEFQDYKGIKVMPTFHPAYLLRDPSKKRETWEDMKKVREYLQKNPREAKQPEAEKQQEIGLPKRE